MNISLSILLGFAALRAGIFLARII
jgi:hypothetical protein